MTDGLHEVGFAEADAAVDEEGVKLSGWMGSDCKSGGMGELVGGADDKGVEGVAGVEASVFVGVGGGVFVGVGRARRESGVGWGVGGRVLCGCVWCGLVGWVY